MKIYAACINSLIIGKSSSCNIINFAISLFGCSPSLDALGRRPVRPRPPPHPTAFRPHLPQVVQGVSQNESKQKHCLWQNNVQLDFATVWSKTHWSQVLCEQATTTKVWAKFRQKFKSWKRPQLHEQKQHKNHIQKATRMTRKSDGPNIS